ncbi:hypothetical protein A3D71_04250 [Candidatus Kaiserbacteria bacterium RIFCSPHIGHO2_02_FULL_55_20]|uniref:DUF5667 domain-containing protein n=1 Tax=Candidatus Kaiserbacteria bacterium RIFCSPHIGHO2_02_FULL_55_20 TaxID=1798497 RepID=A0A1F6DWL0_9BACT|nr:MAG: hypothetical protein A3D71_04250 [Candidatus Kaiserbacteria bacterium RIFCSPHIGHO2_02_FULL_55_20]
MNKQLALSVVLGVIVFGFGFSDSALAVAGEPIAGVDVNLGSNGGLMASSDFGVDSVGTLPTSPFYFFKEWKRGITRLFTFDSIAKAQLELNITNQIAAEVLEVAKTSSTVNYTGLERALQNFTNAQERLNDRLTAISADPGDAGLAKFLNDVDAKTALHAAFLQQLDADTAPGTAGIRAEGVVELVGDVMRKANENTLKTFTATVSRGTGGETPTGSVNFLLKKAADQIQRTEAAIRESELNYKEVAFTATNWNAPQTVAVSNTDDDSAGVKVTVPKQTQGTTFGEKARAGESDIFDRWGKAIAKAKNNLADAKKAFAEEKYGEAYGLARSAEAMVSGIFVSGGATQLQQSKEQRTDESKPAASPETSSKEKIKIGENESSKPEATKPVTEVDIEDTPTPQSAGAKSTSTPEKEKSETEKPAGAGAGPASNYDRAD